MSAIRGSRPSRETVTSIAITLAVTDKDVLSRLLQGRHAFDWRCDPDHEAEPTRLSCKATPRALPSPPREPGESHRERGPHCRNVGTTWSFLFPLRLDCPGERRASRCS